MMLAGIRQCETTGKWSVLSGKCMYLTEESALYAYRQHMEGRICSQNEREQGPVDVGIYSMAGSGTRFIESFMDHIGALYSQRHTDDPQPCFGLRRIIPVRNPRDIYLTHKHRRHTKTDLEFVSTFAEFMWNTEQMTTFYFALDVDKKYRAQMLRECALFCGMPIETVDSFAWGNTHMSDRDRSISLSSEIESRLRFAMSWYHHYTTNWGHSNGA